MHTLNCNFALDAFHSWSSPRRAYNEHVMRKYEDFLLSVCQNPTRHLLMTLVSYQNTHSCLEMKKITFSWWPSNSNALTNVNQGRDIVFYPSLGLKWSTTPHIYRDHCVTIVVHPHFYCFFPFIKFCNLQTIMLGICHMASAKWILFQTW